MTHISKHFLALVILLGIPIGASCQLKPTDISIAYYSQFLFQPGITVGISLPTKSWDSEHERKTGTITRTNSLFWSPQVAVFTQPGSHTSYLANVEFGYRRQIQGKGFYHAASVGLGYLTQFDLLSFTVNLGNGNTEAKDRERHGYIMPTLNYEIGGLLNPNLGWYSKLSAGSKFSTEQVSSNVLFVELGVKIKLSAEATSH